MPWSSGMKLGAKLELGFSISCEDGCKVVEPSACHVRNVTEYFFPNY